MRNGITWKCGQRIKLLKGACAGVHKNNVYATIEYFLLEGLQDESGGKLSLICIFPHVKFVWKCNSHG